MMLKYRSLEMVLEHVELVVSFIMLNSKTTFKRINKLDE